MISAFLLAACASDPAATGGGKLPCGAGTHEESGACVADADTGGTADVDADGDGAPADQDCDDDDRTRYAGATEVCDDVDQDCDGSVDEDAADALVWFIDYDGDSYGTERLTWTGCDAIDGYVANADDCDDTNALIHPGATEDCDGLDNDCNGHTDLCGGGTPSSLADADAKLLGVDTYDGAGGGLCGVGDVDGDGLDDVMVGAYDAGITEVGVAYLYFGVPTGTVSLDTADARVGSDAYINSIGAFMDGAGDVDGDGNPDLLIGAPYTSIRGVYSGAAYVVFGPITADVDLKNADATLAGTQDSEWTGRAVSGAGDVDGDGTDDVLVGAFGWDPGGIERAGAAFLVTGPVVGDSSLRDATASFFGEAYQDDVGASVLGNVDLNGDGVGDVVVGAPNVEFTGSYTFDGGVYAWLGPVSGNHVISAADIVLSGNRNAAGADLGSGDVDGDGTPDLVIGAHGDDSRGAGAGAAYVTVGTLASGALDDLAFKLFGSTDADAAGAAVDCAGDTDGDGFGDVLVGARGYNASTGENAGVAYLVRGPLTGALDLAAADIVLEGEGYSDSAGAAVAGIGDVDGDGLADWMVGATGEDQGGGDAGAAYLFLGEAF